MCIQESVLYVPRWRELEGARLTRHELEDQLGLGVMENPQDLILLGAETLHRVLSRVVTRPDLG